MTDGFHEDTMETSSSNRSELTVGGRRKRGRRRCRCCTCTQGAATGAWAPACSSRGNSTPRGAVSMQCNATGRGDVDPGDPCYANMLCLLPQPHFVPPMLIDHRKHSVSEQWWSLSQATTTATGWISVQAPPGDSEPGTSTTTTRIPRQRQPRSHRLRRR
jgi:hypothetical protein